MTRFMTFTLPLQNKSGAFFWGSKEGVIIQHCKTMGCKEASNGTHYESMSNIPAFFFLNVNTINYLMFKMCHKMLHKKINPANVYQAEKKNNWKKTWQPF